MRTKINQSDLARKAGVPQSKISDIIHGKFAGATPASGKRLEWACVELGIPGLNRFDWLHPSQGRHPLFAKLKTKKPEATNG